MGPSVALREPNWCELAETVDTNQLEQIIGNGDTLLSLLRPHSHTASGGDKELKNFDCKNNELI